MAWYWVKSGGSATGDGGRVTVQPTGSFATRGAANYYPSTQAARGATTIPTTGDFIIISDVSDFTSAGDIESFDVAEVPAFVVSVSDANSDQYSPGAIERTAAGLDFSISTTGGRNISYGVTYVIEDELEMNLPGTALIMYDGVLSFTGSGDRINIQGDATVLQLNNTDIVFEAGTANHVMQILGNPRFEMTGGAITATTGAIADLIGGSSAANGGMTVEMNGVDLTDIDGFLLADTGSAYTVDDNFEVNINGCKLSASLTGFSEEAFSSPGHVMNVTNSSSAAAAAEYQASRKRWLGVSEDQDSAGIHLDETQPYEISGEKTSLKVTTTANCSIANPFAFEIIPRRAKLDTAAEDTLTVRLVLPTATTATDAEIWIVVQNPDNTTKNLWNYVSSRNTDILAAGTTLTDDSGSVTWKNGVSDLTGHNEYRIDLAISNGADSVPKVMMYVAIPSLAGTMYADAVYTVS